METKHNSGFNQETLREQLSEQRINEFVQSLINRNEMDAQRYNLLSLASKALEELLQTEREMITDFLSEAENEICPGCLIMHTRDVTNIESTIELFNKYLSKGNTCDAG